MKKLYIVPETHPDEPKELLALTASKEEAEEIAGLYRITLKSFSDGVAVYITDQDPSDLIAFGKRNGYPTLSVNHKRHLF